MVVKRHLFLAAPLRTQPSYAQENPRFAEGLSHLTLDVGVRRQADCPSPPTNVRMTPTYPKMTESLGLSAWT